MAKSSSRMRELVAHKDRRNKRPAQIALLKATG